LKGGELEISNATIRRKRTDLSGEQGFLDWLASMGGALLAIAELLFLLGYAISEIIRVVRSMPSGQVSAWQ